MVGDNLDLDVTAARAAGLCAVHLDRDAGHVLRDLLATALRPKNPAP
jgi:putative hydrolase of the HAD superfamily